MSVRLILFFTMHCAFTSLLATSHAAPTNGTTSPSSEALRLLELREVVTSARRHFPEVLAALAKQREVVAKLKEAEGAFDGTIELMHDERLTGYYNGQVTKGQLVKPLPFLNLKLKGGGRISAGEFPSYEGKSVTGDDGEWFGGVSLSLLQDSLIDEKRFKIRRLAEDIVQAEQSVRLREMLAQALSVEAYWNWSAAFAQRDLSQRLLNLALSREQALKRQVKAGDKAEIDLVDIQQTLDKRWAEVKKADLLIELSAMELALFARNDSGNMRSGLSQFLPQNLSSQLRDEIKSLSDLVADVMAASPEIQNLESQLRQAQLLDRLGQNSLLPRLDLGAEVSEDQKPEQSELVGTENRIFLNLVIPIEWNRGLGQRRQASAETDALVAKLNLTKQKLTQKTRMLHAKIVATQKILARIDNQVAGAFRLVQAENQRFQSGDSDMIRVMFREQYFAESQVTQIETRLQLMLAYNDLMTLLMKPL